MDQFAPVGFADAPHTPKAPLLLSVPETARRLGPAFPEPTLRDFVYHSQPRLCANGDRVKANGFGVCVVKLGHKVLLDWERVLGWIESHRQQEAA